MRIGVDIDDVIADLVPSIADYFNRRNGTKVSKEDFVSQDYSVALKNTNREAVEVVGNFILDGGLENLEPIKHSQEVLRQLSTKHAIYAVTSRQPIAETSTFKWLEEHFPGIFEHVLFSLNSYVPTDRNLSKKDICMNWKLDVMVEDAIEYALLFEGCGIDVILFDQPWNQSMDESKHPHIKRAKGWLNAQALIEKLE